MAYAFNEDKSKVEVFTKEEIFNVIYPVGSIYMSANNVNPATLFGGTWQKIEGRFMLASGSGYNLGGTGGSANATIPSHTHKVSGSVANNGNHTHSVSGNTGENGNHTHTFGTAEDPEPYGERVRLMAYYGNTGVARRGFASGSLAETWASNPNDRNTITMSDATEVGGAHKHSFFANTSQNGQHNHSFNVTSGSTGTSATGANMPPYLVVNVWKRTA